MTAELPPSAQPVDVAFVTVNYNTRQLVEEMVRFFRTTPLPFSFVLVVVDNASADGSLDFLATCPEVVTVRNGENLGYGRAMNRGIAACSSRYVCALNTDLVLNGEALAALWRHLESHPRTGVASPRICYPGGRTQGFVFFDGIIPLYFALVSKLMTKYHKWRVERASRPLRVDGVLGAFMFLRRELCPGGRLFDEDFFFYYEDTELARRLTRQGVRCDVLPDHAIVHLGGQSTSVRNSIQYYRSRYLYVRKQYGPGHAALLMTLDRWRIRRKALFYSLMGKLFPSDTVKAKRQLYASILDSLASLTAGEQA